MKTTIYTVLILFLALSCVNKNKKKDNAVALSDSLSFYFEKVDNEMLAHKERIDFNGKALRIILEQEEQEQDSLFIDNLFKVANHYHNMGEWERYKNIILRISKKADKLKDTPNIAKVEAYLGDYYNSKTLYDSAYLSYSNAEYLYNKLRDRKNTGVMVFNKSLLFYNEGFWSISEKVSLEALTFFNVVDDRQQIYQVYNHLGVLSDDLEKYDKAIDYYNKAFDFIKYETIDDSYLLKAITLNNLGFSYQNKNEDKKAIDCYNKALKEGNLYKNRPSLYASLLDNLAFSKLKIKDYSQLPELFNKAFAIRDSLQIIPGMVMSKLHLSEYYRDKKDMEKSFQYAEQAYTIAKTKGIDPRDVLLALKQLHSLDNNKKRNVHFAEWVRISDSIRKVESMQLIDKVERVKFNFDTERFEITKN